MATQYQVYGELRMRTGNAQAALQRISDQVGGLAARLRGAESVGSRLFRGLAAFGAGYLGLSALMNGLRRAGSSMLEFYDQTEQANIRIATLATAIEHVPFEEARRRAGGFIDTLRQLALQSPATGQDLVNIFADISGPIARVTGSMEDALQASQTLANATGALGLGQDYGQAARDFRAILEGRAGVDVRTFSSLRSLGLISQTTEQWNQMALHDPEQAYTQLMDILGQFNIAAAAQGNSLSGLVSSLQSVAQEVGGAFSGPLLERVKAFMRTILGRILENFDGIKAAARGLGEQMAESLEHAFRWIVGRIDWITQHWSELTERFHQIVGQLRKAASVFAAISGARMAAGAALGGGASLISGGVGALSGIGGLAQFAQMAAGLGGGGAAAAGAAGAGGTVGLAGIAAFFASPAGIATIVAGLGAIVATLTALAGVATIGAGVFQELTQHGDEWASFFAAELAPAWAELSGVFGLLYTELEPLLALIGRGALIGLVVALRWVVHWLVQGILMMIATFRAAMGPIQTFATVLVGLTDTANEEFGGFLLAVSHFFEGLAAMRIPLLSGVAEGAAQTAATTWRRYFRRGPGGDLPELDEAATAAADAASDAGGEDRASHGTTVNIHHMEVRQDFREADPDRVFVRMIREIEGEAERRLSSEFAPLLTR